MKLLFLTHRLPCPPDRGCKQRSAALLRWLAGRHEVWCAGFLDAQGIPELQAEAARSLAELRDLCRQVEAVPFSRWSATGRALGSLLVGRSATERYFASGRLEREVRQWAAAVRFDAVLAFSSGMAPLALKVPAQRHVLCMDDLDSQKWLEASGHSPSPMSWAYRIEGRRLARREREWIAAFDATIMVNQREADLVTDPTLHRRVQVIPATLPVNLDSDASKEIASLPEDPIVGFVGAMDYAPNIEAACWFTESIWPRVLQRCPAAQWWIVGRSPTSVARRLDNGRSIRVTGSVPAIEPYLERMRVHVAPLRRSRGVQMKVLNAMAAGRPCVVTSPVAEGLQAQPDRDLLVADEPEEFAQAVIDLLTDASRAKTVGQSGRQFVVQRLRNDEGLMRLERLLEGSNYISLDSTHPWSAETHRAKVGWPMSFPARREGGPPLGGNGLGGFA